MKKIKLFSSTGIGFSNLEIQINEFLSKIPATKIIDIKPTESYIEGDWSYTVIIIYYS